MKPDLERIIIDELEFYGKEMIDRHIARYNWATSYLKSTDIILDVCCGTGYGSNILSEKCVLVYGFDNNSEAIEYANKRYKKNNIHFRVKDLRQAYLITNEHKLDAIVFIEAIEHFTEKEILPILDMFYRELRNTGKLILTTPDKSQSKGENQYHKHEYTEQEIVNLLSQKFRILEKEVKDNFIYIVAEKNGNN